MKSAEYWNTAGSNREFNTPLPPVFFDLVSWETLILDLGCGYGRTLAELRRAGYENLRGVDSSEKMIERGRARYPDLDLRVNDGRFLDFPDQTFGAVLLTAVLTCVIRDQDQEDLLAEVERVLKPGGLICVNDFLLNQDRRNLERYQKYQSKYGTYGVFELPDGAVLRHHDPARVISSLAHFSTIHFDSVTLTTMNGNQSQGYHFIGSKTIFSESQTKTD
jgi:Methylase involved in ubiquinone/menaquinone biosynthesis